MLSVVYVDTKKPIIIASNWLLNLVLSVNDYYDGFVACAELLLLASEMIAFLPET